MTREDFVTRMDRLLKLVRTEYGLSQEKMALALGISKKTLVEIEKGRRTLGWTGAVACGCLFGGSTILENEFGGELTDLLRSLGLDDLHPVYPRPWAAGSGGTTWRPDRAGASSATSFPATTGCWTITTDGCSRPSISQSCKND